MKLLVIEHSGDLIAMGVLQIAKNIVDHEDPTLDRKIAQLTQVKLREELKFNSSSF